MGFSQRRDARAHTIVVTDAQSRQLRHFHGISPAARGGAAINYDDYMIARRP